MASDTKSKVAALKGRFKARTVERGLARQRAIAQREDRGTRTHRQRGAGGRFSY